MALLDVNALVALVWDSHVHHAAIRRWFRSRGGNDWATCTVTESGFVRVSSNPRVLPSPVSVDEARRALSLLRQATGHRFLANDVSPCDDDVGAIAGHSQVTDAVLVTLARRQGMRLVTFDSAAATLGTKGDVELLGA